MVERSEFRESDRSPRDTSVLPTVLYSYVTTDTHPYPRPHSLSRFCGRKFRVLVPESRYWVWVLGKDSRSLTQERWSGTMSVRVKG